MPLILILSAAFLTACSESISVFVHHDCPDPVPVTIVDDWFDQAPKLVDPGIDVAVYSICCEPGQNGELIISSGRWTETVSYDRLREDPLVVIPPEACHAP